MAYSGLDNTTVWATLPSQGIDTCKYRAIMVAGQLSITGSYYWPGCPFTTHYADSLGMRGPCK